MKIITFCFIFCCLITVNAKSQDSLKTTATQTRLPAYKAEINLTDGESFKVYLMAIKDSSVFTYEKKGTSPDPLHKTKVNKYDQTSWSRYVYHDIGSIKIINQRTRTWAALSGLLIGITAGVIVGNSLSKGTGINGEINSAAGTFLGGLIGAGVGVVTGVIVAGAFDKKYLINGEWKSLEDLKATLKN